MSFQWDILLLEVGFLAIFLTPKSNITVWLFWWLLFRFMFSSGIAKILSGDASWRDLSALQYHYETQPLPTIFAWFAHQFPASIHRFAVAMMFLVELAFPFLLIFPRRLRFFGGLGFILLQALIFITGNYTFFNILTVAITLLIFDDSFWQWIFPSSVWQKIILGVQQHGFSWPWTSWHFGISEGWIQGVLLAVAIVYVGLSVLLLSFRIDRRVSGRAVATLLGPAQRFHIVNNYGLFSVMTKKRQEIVIEGSENGEDWKAYEFAHKPGNMMRAPTWVQPHQPRLDWQMWFAALGNAKQMPWFSHLMYRLLQGSPDVLKLFADNPFPEQPPKYVRAVLYEYHFSDQFTRGLTSAWWTRERKGFYFPETTLDSFRQESR